MEATPVKLNFSNKGADGMNTPEAYEKLLYDCIRGDATNFTHWDEVALSWSFTDKISEVWENTKEASFPNYQAGTMGPKAADELLEKTAFFGGRSQILMYRYIKNKSPLYAKGIYF